MANIIQIATPADATYERLLAGLAQEYNPVTPTENFLVSELAQSQWRIWCARRLEAELLNAGGDDVWSRIAELEAWESAARRAWHEAFNQLKKRRPSASPKILQFPSGRRAA